MVVFGCGLKGGEGVRLRRVGLEAEEASATLGIADLSLEFGLLFEFSFAELFGISEQETAGSICAQARGPLRGRGTLWEARWRCRQSGSRFRGPSVVHRGPGEGLAVARSFSEADAGRRWYSGSWR